MEQQRPLPRAAHHNPAFGMLGFTHFDQRSCALKPSTRNNDHTRRRTERIGIADIWRVLRSWISKKDVGGVDDQT